MNGSFNADSRLVSSSTGLGGNLDGAFGWDDVEKSLDLCRSRVLMRGCKNGIEHRD